MRDWAKAKGDGRLKTLPPVAQRRDWTCGPAALRAALKQLGREDPGEDAIARLAGTSRDAGTPPGDMVRAASKLGLQAATKKLSSAKDLEPLVQRGRAVILDIQSLDSPASGWKFGHYVVLRRAEAGQVEVMDPMGGSFKKLTYAELEKRWHDEEASGKRTERLAIILG